MSGDERGAGSGAGGGGRGRATRQQNQVWRTVPQSSSTSIPGWHVRVVSQPKHEGREHGPDAANS